jgi:SNF2 family DNA or RNA helicase
VLIASSHLARRRERRDQIIQAGPWDIVLVDEAHHARRSGSKATDTPNTLLALLQTMQMNRSWKSLYLASATPMQMNAHEAWDLLELLGLTKRWGESAETFTKYYTELREPFGSRQWEFLRRMSEDFFSDGSVAPDPVLTEQVKEKLGLAKSKPIRNFATNGLSSEARDQVEPEVRTWLDEWLRRHTPMRDRVFRTTRSTLRHYKEIGLLDASATIPVRDVKDRFVPFTPDEQALYDRIEAYISKYYDAYMSGPQAQKPLGFIMTVYRRRLTSSFLAIERSLQRRRAVLVDGAAATGLLDPDDVAALEYSALFDVANLPDVKANIASEVKELDSFLADLAKRPPDESKMSYLHNELEDAFKGVHDTAIVFTQYTDTMEYLRNQLVSYYGDRVACWSGNGGERWSESSKTWESITKAELKALFRAGKDVKILLGTDSMSEGLNLQTCGLLINYDMPWNFMRVEQRIGRVDRIGGRPEVAIRNYFYVGTVEEQIYTGIADDVDWFEDIVGPAQPVLGQVEDVIEHIAMQMPNADRDQAVLEEIAKIRAAIEEAKARAVSMDDIGRAPGDEDPRDLHPAIDLVGLENVLTRAEPVASRFHPHPTIAGAYLLEISGGKVEVTFRRSVLEAHPEVKLLTYATEELEDLLNDVPSKEDEIFKVGGAAVHSLLELEKAFGLPR